MPKPVGGRGIKAPYETTHVRVPVPIKDKVQALIDEFRDGYIRQPEKSSTGLDELGGEESKSLQLSALEIIKFQAEVINYFNLEIQSLNEELDLRVEELELQRQSIQSQKEELGIQREEIQFQDQEIQFQDQEIESQNQELQLQHRELQYKNSLTGYKNDREVNLLTSLEDAKREARKQLRSKKGKYSEVAELLSFIYKVKVTKEDLEA